MDYKKIFTKNITAFTMLGGAVAMYVNLLEDEFILLFVIYFWITIPLRAEMVNEIVKAMIIFFGPYK